MYKSDLKPFLERMDALHKQGYYIEVFLLFCAFFESALADLLDAYEQVVVEEVKSVRLRIKDFRAERPRSFGGQLKFLKIFCDDQGLIAEIDEIIRVRNSIVHRINFLDLGKHDDSVKASLYPKWADTLLKIMELRISLIASVKTRP